MSYNTKTSALLLLPILGIGAFAFSPQSASALSCMETGQYLTSIVNNNETVIFTGTVSDTIESTDYTAEVLQVKSAEQGYVESEIMVYHQKHPDWGYLCNTGPAKKGITSLYVATRNDAGQYQVSTRLDTTQELATTLQKQLDTAKVEGEVVESTRLDRANQIMSTITDLFKQIGQLLKEYQYWASTK